MFMFTINHLLYFFANKIIIKFIVNNLFTGITILHRLNLDAPLVLVMWRNLASNRVPEALHLIELFILGSSTWLAYTADRFFEKIEYCPNQRSRFSIGRQNPQCFILLWVVCLLVTVWVSSEMISYPIWIVGWSIACLVFLNFILNLFEYPKRGLFLSKRVRTSAILATGCIFWDIGNLSILRILILLISFFLIFELNCFLIEDHEQRQSKLQDMNIFSYAEYCLKLLKIRFLLIGLVSLALWSISFEILALNFATVVIMALFLKLACKDVTSFRINLDAMYWFLPLCSWICFNGL